MMIVHGKTSKSDPAQKARDAVPAGRRPESGIFNMIWMPNQVRHVGSGAFYDAINFK